MKIPVVLLPLVGFLNRNWLVLLAVWAVLALGLAGAIVWKTHEAKKAATSNAPVLTRKEVKALKNALANEQEKRKEDSAKVVVLEKNWIQAEKKAIIHEQRADSILNNTTNEAAAAATLSAPGGLQRFLANYKPGRYRASRASRDTLR